MANLPEFTQPTPRKRPSAMQWLSWLSIPLLAIALIVQVLVADRARLAADAHWRPRIIVLCGWLGCQVPPWREPSALHITSREIRPHPSAPGVLLVTATFRNDAAFAQPWPQLQLSLANLEGEALGLRRFSPEEDLGSEPATPLIAPGLAGSASAAAGGSNQSGTSPAD